MTEEAKAKLPKQTEVYRQEYDGTGECPPDILTEEDYKLMAEDSDDPDYPDNYPDLIQQVLAEEKKKWDKNPI